MTSRAKLLALSLLLIMLALLLVREWVVRVTSPEALEARFNQRDEGEPALYRLHVGATRVGLLAGTFSALEVTLEPDSAELTRRAETGTPARTRYAISIPRVEVTGISRASLLRGDFEALGIALHDLDVRVWLDRGIPDGEAPEPIPLPHERLRALDRGVVVGRASIHDGRFRYFERSPDGARFGLLEFDSVQASAAAITNRLTGEPGEGVIPIEIAGRLAGKARLTSSMLYYTGAPDFNLVVNGGLGPTDAQILNPLLMDLEGVRISEGVVDSIAWEIEVEDGAAEGRMVALYRDLAMEKVEKVTRAQDLGDEIASFFGNAFLLNRSNPATPGTSPLVVPLAHRRAPTEPFLRFLWVTLRGGLLQTVGL